MPSTKKSKKATFSPTERQKMMIGKLQRGLRFSKCGKKIYQHDNIKISSQFQIPLTAYEQLLFEGIIKTVGGQITLVENVQI